MTENELQEDILLELESISIVVAELIALRDEWQDQEPTLRDKTAAATFFAQFYNGIENILKRICKYHSVEMPDSASWHMDLFELFCDPPHSPLPMLFDSTLEMEIAPFRKFRHLAHHVYGFHLDWNRLKQGIDKIEGVHQKVHTLFSKFVASM